MVVVLLTESQRRNLLRFLASAFCRRAIWLAALSQFLLLVVSPWPFPSWAEVLQGVLLGFFVLEQAAKLVSLPPWKLRSFPKCFDLAAVVCLLVAQLLPTFKFGAFPSRVTHATHRHYENVTDPLDPNVTIYDMPMDDETTAHRSVTLGGGWLKLQIALRSICVLRLLSIGRGTREMTRKRDELLALTQGRAPECLEPLVEIARALVVPRVAPADRRRRPHRASSWSHRGREVVRCDD